MPTTRPRHPVTETDDITIILDQAALRWGNVPRSQLIRHIILDWAADGRSSGSRARARDGIVGSLPGSADLYDSSQDWPA